MKRAINFALLALAVACASVPRNRYGLQVVPDAATYERLAARDPDKRWI